MSGSESVIYISLSLAPETKRASERGKLFVSTRATLRTREIRNPLLAWKSSLTSDLIRARGKLLYLLKLKKYGDGARRGDSPFALSLSLLFRPCVPLCVRCSVGRELPTFAVAALYMLLRIIVPVKIKENKNLNNAKYFPKHMQFVKESLHFSICAICKFSIKN
jgi:hypothetical protein